MDEWIDAFLHNIVWLRKHYQLSKKSMAKLLHISVATLNQIECGELPLGLTAEVTFYIYHCFGITVKDQFELRLGADKMDA